MRKFIYGLALATALTACGTSNPPEGGAAGGPASIETDAEAEKVTLILDYVPNTNHTGFYAAQRLGYFADENLQVEIIEPADGAVAALVAAGKGQFGISYQEDVTYALTTEQPLPIKAIAAIIQHNTSGFASFAGKSIKRPKDFEGRTYAGWGSPSEEAVINAVVKADGGDPSKVNIVVSDGSGYGALKDKVDIMWFFWAWDGIASQRAGIPVNYIELREFDKRLDYYTPVIITSNDIAANNPELARRFLAASKKGYEYCIQNPAEAAEILREHADTYDIEMLIESQEYLAGKYSEDTDAWGVMKDEVWNGYTDFMLEHGLITQDIEASECYTNEFLPKN